MLYVYVYACYNFPYSVDTLLYFTCQGRSLRRRLGTLESLGHRDFDVLQVLEYKLVLAIMEPRRTFVYLSLSKGSSYLNMSSY